MKWIDRGGGVHILMLKSRLARPSSYLEVTHWGGKWIVGEGTLFIQELPRPSVLRRIKQPVIEALL